MQIEPDQCAIVAQVEGERREAGVRADLHKILFDMHFSADLVPDDPVQHVEIIQARLYLSRRIVFNIVGVQLTHTRDQDVFRSLFCNTSTWIK